MKIAHVPLVTLLGFSLGRTDGFAPAFPSTTTTALNLLPNQGCQLAAAAAAAYSKDGKKSPSDDDSSKSSVTSTPTNAARELANRIFNLPAQILNIPEDSRSKGFPFELIADHELDEVVYPVVGFQFVKLENGSMRAVPSPDAINACNFNNIRRSNTEPVYGWFSPACHLGHSYADEHYCMEPKPNDG